MAAGDRSGHNVTVAAPATGALVMLLGLRETKLGPSGQHCTSQLDLKQLLVLAELLVKVLNNE